MKSITLTNGILIVWTENQCNKDADIDSPLHLCSRMCDEPIFPNTHSKNLYFMHLFKIFLEVFHTEQKAKFVLDVCRFVSNSCWQLVHIRLRRVNEGTKSWFRPSFFTFPNNYNYLKPCSHLTSAFAFFLDLWRQMQTFSMNTIICCHRTYS